MLRLIFWFHFHGRICTVQDTLSIPLQPSKTRQSCLPSAFLAYPIGPTKQLADHPLVTSSEITRLCLVPYISDHRRYGHHVHEADSRRFPVPAEVLVAIDEHIYARSAHRSSSFLYLSFPLRSTSASLTVVLHKRGIQREGYTRVVSTGNHQLGTRETVRDLWWPAMMPVVARQGVERGGGRWFVVAKSLQELRLARFALALASLISRVARAEIEMIRMSSVPRQRTS